MSRSRTVAITLVYGFSFFFRADEVVCFTWEETDFGQSRFGHPDLTNFGQSNFGHLGFGPANFGQNQFWPIQFWPIHFGPIHFWIWCVSWRQRVGPKPRKKSGPEGWGAEGWGAQNFALLFPLPPPFRSFCLSLGVFSWNFGGVFEGPSP